MSLLQIESVHTRSGINAGLIAGVVFGALLGMMGMLPRIAGLVGAESALAGFILHLVFSAIIGALFAVLFGHEARQPGSGIISGVIYGGLWWILGPLIIMPLWMGMGLQLSASAAAAALPSLWGHLIYGFILSLIYQRTAQNTDPHEEHDKQDE